jgi:hypothetical protein
MMLSTSNGNGDGLEQPKKQQKSNESEPIIISPPAEHHQMKTDADIWWHSGDARKFLAPTNLYGNSADIRKNVVERIGIMEDVNTHWDNWRKVVYGGDSQLNFEVCIWHMQ